MSGTVNIGLSPSDIVSVNINLEAAGVVGAGLNTLLIVGTTLGVIPLSTRIFSYSGATILTQVEEDFGTEAQEYLATLAYMDQSPQPTTLQIGFWNAAGTPAILTGGVLTPTQQMISNFTGITDGAITIVTGTGAGTSTDISGINFSAVTDMQDVATAFNNAITSGEPTLSWNASTNQFQLATATKGAAAVIQWCTAGTGTGTTDISSLLQLTSAAQANGGSLVNGVAAETPATAINALRQTSSKWYCAHFAVANGAAGNSFLTTETEILSVAQAVQAFGTPTIFGFTSQDPNDLVQGNTTSIPYQFSKLALYRTFFIYSSTNPYAGCSLFGLMAGIDFTGSDTAITLKFKTLPGIQPELLTEVQAAALSAIFCNVYAQYSDGVAITQQGTMSDGTFIDEVQNVDYVATTTQAAVISPLITNGKVPQTDSGMQLLLAQIDNGMAGCVTNGIIGEGLTWQGGPVGTIVSGTVLPNGWYIYQPSLASQSAAQRSTRDAPLFQICFNFAGAVHFASVQLNVVR